jgi:hypothetical protein
LLEPLRPAPTGFQNFPPQGGGSKKVNRKVGLFYLLGDTAKSLPTGFQNFPPQGGCSKKVNRKVDLFYLLGDTAKSLPTD